MKWRKFKGFFPKYRDEDDKLNRRLKMFVPPAGQNRINAAGRFGSVDEGDPTRFAAMQHWTMTFWRRMPRTATRYLSEENQIRDACEQTISDSELLMKAADTRASLFDWDTRHVRWSLLKADHQEQLSAPGIFTIIAIPFLAVSFIINLYIQLLGDAPPYIAGVEIRFFGTGIIPA